MSMSIDRIDFLFFTDPWSDAAAYGRKSHLAPLPVIPGRRLLTGRLRPDAAGVAVCSLLGSAQPANTHEDSVTCQHHIASLGYGVANVVMDGYVPGTRRQSSSMRPLRLATFGLDRPDAPCSTNTVKCERSIDLSPAGTTFASDSPVCKPPKSLSSTRL
ncbi:hypothetical protein BV20DRAFT_385768 [Pilatotrama ljubarskyi]|nr:hypothetical protein BV20DRAFT_385768 [Pilatotrama ljubarskyi]